MKKTFFILSLLITFSVASADLVPIGDPIEGDSWAQAFNESGVGYFDFVAVLMVSDGDTFESFTHTNFNRSGWSTKYENPSDYPVVATATGLKTNNLTWTIHFAGSKSDPLAFNFVAFEGNTLKEAAYAEWTGSKWNISLIPDWDIPRAEIPLPGAAILGILGLGAAGLKLRRKEE